MPFLREGRIRENACGDRRTVIRRHGIDAAGDLQHVTLNRVGARFVLAHGDDRTDALAIQTEILGMRDGDQRLRQRLGHEAKSRHVLREVGSESLIGQVDERHETLAGAQLRERAPLLERQVGAARVVTGRVHEHDVSRAALLQAIEHFLEEQPVQRRRRNRDSARASIRSCRGAARDCPRSDRSEHRVAGATARIELGAHAQSAASTGRLGGARAPHGARRVRSAQARASRRPCCIPRGRRRPRRIWSFATREPAARRGVRIRAPVCCRSRSR